MSTQGSEPTITIRPLMAADVPAVLAINQANVPAVGSINAERLRFLVEESLIALVVESADWSPWADDPATGAADPSQARAVIAGFCLVIGQGSTYDSLNYRWFMERYRDACYLDRVAFDAALQGRGLGTALYAAVDEAIAARRVLGEHIARLTLEVNVDPPNEQSLAFHARRGFVEVGRRDTGYDIEVSLMEKTYDPAAR